MQDTTYIYRAFGLCDQCWWNMKETGSPSHNGDFYTGRTLKTLLSNIKGRFYREPDKVPYQFNKNAGWTLKEDGMYEKKAETYCQSCREKLTTTTIQAIPVISTEIACEYCHSTGSIKIEVQSVRCTDSFGDRISVAFICNCCGKEFLVKHDFYGLRYATSIQIGYNNISVKQNQNL